MSGRATARIVGLMVLAATADAPAGAQQTREPSLASLRAAYDRSDYQAVAEGVRAARDVRRIIRQASDAIEDAKGAVDPARAPRRISRQELLFGLEFTAAVLFAGPANAHADAERLLSRYQSWMTVGFEVDAFECTWHLTAVAIFEGRGAMAPARSAVELGRQRCPESGRLVLAHARLLDREWTFSGGRTPLSPMTIRVAPGANWQEVPRADPRVQGLVSAYEAAMTKPEAADEARIRLAWVLVRANDLERSGQLLDGVPPSLEDRQMRYIAELFRGHVLAARDQWEAASAAFRRALEVWPDAQSARVSLMTAQLAQGAVDSAVALANAVEAAPDRSDPWWLYYGGDMRMYAQLVGRLRELR